MPRTKTPSEQVTYSIPEVAKLLSISVPHAYKVVREGLVPSLRLGKRVVIPKAALDKLLSCDDQLSGV